jgi:hypothetical protein
LVVQPSSSTRRDLDAVSGQLLELLTALEQALIAETDALRARDVDALERAVESKRRTLRLLERMRPADNGGNGNAETSQLLERCRVLNDIAGSAIAVLRQDTSYALGLLGIESEASGYGSPGRPRRESRALAVC